MFDVINNPTIKQYYNFSTDLDIAKVASSKGHYVSYFSPRELDLVGAKLAITPCGLAGFAVTKTGKLIALFKHPKFKEKNVLARMLPLAKLMGARELECFDGYLATQYKLGGFREVSRSSWNDEYAPADWPETAQKPDYLTMRV